MSQGGWRAPGYLRVGPGPLILEHSLDSVDGDLFDAVELRELALEDVYIGTGRAYDKYA